MYGLFVEEIEKIAAGVPTSAVKDLYAQEQASRGFKNLLSSEDKGAPWRAAATGFGAGIGIPIAFALQGLVQDQELLKQQAQELIDKTYISEAVKHHSGMNPTDARAVADSMYRATTVGGEAARGGSLFERFRYDFDSALESESGSGAESARRRLKGSVGNARFAAKARRQSAEEVAEAGWQATKSNPFYSRINRSAGTIPTAKELNTVIEHGKKLYQQRAHKVMSANAEFAKIFGRQLVRSAPLPLLAGIIGAGTMAQASLHKRKELDKLRRRAGSVR